MKQTTGDWLILIVIAIILGLGFVQHFTYKESTNQLEQRLNALTGQYNRLGYYVNELEEDRELNKDSIEVIQAELKDYINKHEFDHDIDLVLSKAELHLYIEEQVKKYLESDGE